jgi:hypothetical protein
LGEKYETEKEKKWENGKEKDEQTKDQGKIDVKNVK